MDEELVRAYELARMGPAGEFAAEAVRLLYVQAIYTAGWDTLIALVGDRPEEFRIQVIDALIDHQDKREVDRVLKLFFTDMPFDRHLGTVERLFDEIARHGVTFCPLLVPLADAWLRAGRQLPPPIMQLIRRLAALGSRDLSEIAETPGYVPLNSGDAWTDQAIADLASMDEMWSALVAHAAKAASAKPSTKWDQRAEQLLGAVGHAAAEETICRWLSLVHRPRSVDLPDGGVGVMFFDPYNAFCLRGLIWMLSLLPAQPESARILGDVVEMGLRKVGSRQRSPMVANAAVYALSRMPGEPALAQLARLAQRVTFKPTLKQIDAALDKRARDTGLTRADLEELSVPSYGLTGVGPRTFTFGPVTAHLAITGNRTAITWWKAASRAKTPTSSPNDLAEEPDPSTGAEHDHIGAESKPEACVQQNHADASAGSGSEDSTRALTRMKAMPASVRNDHSRGLADLRAAAKEIDGMLSAQVDRLDRLFLEERVWGFKVWRERYLDHPLVGALGRRLIWLVGDVPCGWAAGALRTVDDRAVVPPDGAAVRLWHPAGRAVAEVLGWRDWLERHQITQPFKQAHREVYPLTAAEEETRTYSNRYAGHILRQHQFHALATVRGWRNRLRLAVEDILAPPTLELPHWGLRAEFWVEGVDDDILDSRAFAQLATDQVRFYPISAPLNYASAGGGRYSQGHAEVPPLPLVDVPPLAFSEVMRDIDLFVGVASVGNDPTWQDGGPAGRFRDYWASYSFGELSGSAQTRRDLLTRLLPRLAIGDRCAIQDRFLHVRGDLRTYKIHLGSGNILMTPGDYYLCIVPKQAPEHEEVFLPFEGDRTLAVILSKATLLADDTAITDPTITRQIRA